MVVSLNVTYREYLAHDICADYYHNGVGQFFSYTLLGSVDTYSFSDVTMYQRSSTYVLSATKGWKVIMKGKSVSSLNQFSCA